MNKQSAMHWDENYVVMVLRSCWQKMARLVCVPFTQQRIQPKTAMEVGYKFKYERIDQALKQILNR